MKHKLLLLNGDFVEGDAKLTGGAWQVTIAGYYTVGRIPEAHVPAEGDVINVPDSAVAWWV